MTLALPGKSRRRQGALVTAALFAVIAAVFGAIALITSASAHSAIISGTTVCNADGTWTVNWTVQNDYNLKMTINSAEDSTGNSVAMSPNPVDASPGQPYNSATGAATYSSSVDSVSLAVDATWTDNFNDQFSSDEVDRPLGCGDKITISEGACADAGADAWSFHFVASNTDEGDGGTITVTYKYDSESTTYTTTQAENGNGSHANWHVSIPFNGHGTITIVAANASGGAYWNGVNGVDKSVADDTCGSTPESSISLQKSDNVSGAVAAGGTFNWTIAVTVRDAATTADQTVTDTIPSGMTAGAPSADNPLDCSATAGNSISCKLPSGTAIGTYNITIPVTAPSGNVAGNCKAYDNIAHAGSIDSNTDTVSVTGCGTPGVTFTKSDDTNGSVAAGGTFHWVLTAQVTGGPTPEVQTYTDTIPAGMTAGTPVASSPFDCSASSGNSISCNLPGSTPIGTYTITIPVTAPAGDIAANCKAYTNTAFRGEASSNPDTVEVTGCATADISLTKSHSPSGNIAAGSSFDWKIAVTVTGAAVDGDKTITDSIPAGFTVTNAPTADSIITCSSGTSNSVSCTLPGGTQPGTYTITIPVKAPASTDTSNCTTYDNTAHVGDANSNTDQVTVTSCGTPSVSLSKSDDTDGSIAARGSFNWKVKVTVSGAKTITSQAITDAIPTGFIVTATPTSDSPITCSSGTSNSVSCTLPSGTNPGEYTITIPVKAPTGTQGSGICTDYTNTAHAGDIASNGDTVTVTDCTPPSVSLVKANDTDNSVAAGGSFHWDLTVTVTNGPTITGTAFSDTIPAAFAIGTLPSGCTKTGQAVTCTLASGATDGAHTFAIPVTAPAAVPFANCKAYTNNASITSGGSGSDDDTVTVTDCIPPTLTLDKSDDLTGSNVAAGGTFHWILTVTVGDGPTLTDYAISDAIPAGFAIGTLPFGCTNAGQTVTCTVAAGAANGEHSFSIPVTAPAKDLSTNCHAYTNTAHHGDDSASDTVTVTGCNPPLVTISKSDDTANSSVVAGGAFNWIVTVTVSNGPTRGAHEITDDISAITGGFTVTGNPVTSVGISCDSGASSTVHCTLPDGSANGSYTITIPVQAPAASDGVCNKTYQNTAILSPEQTTASDTIDVTCDPIVTFAKSDNTDHIVAPGQAFNWVLTTHVSHGPTQSDALITDTVPAAFQVTSISTSADSALDCSATVGNAINCTLKKGAANGDHVVTISVTAPVASDEVCNNTFTNTAHLGDLSPADDVTVSCEPIVTLAKSDNTGGAVDSNGSFDWVLTATVSHGPTAAARDITDTIPDGFTINSVDPGPGITCDAVSGQLISCTLASGSANGSYTIHINVTAPHASQRVCNQSVTNIASMGDLSPQDTVKVICEEIVVKKFSDPTANMSGSGGLLDGWTVSISDNNGIVASGTTGDDGAGTVIFLVDPGSYTVSETGQAGWVIVGSTVDGVSVTGEAGQSRTVASTEAGSAEVHFFNQPVGSITIIKTEATPGAPIGVAGIGWNFTITGCGITRTGTTQSPDGSLTFDNLPLCIYTVTEDTSSKPDFVISPATPNNRTLTLDAPGENRHIGFTNFKVVSGCTIDCGPVIPPTTPTPTPTITTPTPTPATTTATPTPPTTTPSPSPTESTTVTPTQTETTTATPSATPTTPGGVLSASTPSRGVSDQPTPLPPVTGNGTDDNHRAVWMFFAGLGLLAFTVLFGAASLRRKSRN